MTIINTDNAVKERKNTIKEIAYALEAFSETEHTIDECKDILAFIALSLFKIWETVDKTTTAWENRGYWVKADKFRMQWFWTNRIGNNLVQSIKSDDQNGIFTAIEQIRLRLGEVEITKKVRTSSPWKDARSYLEKMPS